jgi:hypothetical protein
VVISHGPRAISTADAANLDALRELLGSRLVGELEPLSPEASVPRGAIDLNALVGTR